MANDLLLPVVLLGGLATYLIRFLPMHAAERLNGRALPPWCHRFLLALGPSAIAALLALALADLLPIATFYAAAPAVLAGVIAVLALYRLTTNPAWSTLAGAIAYGLIHIVITV
ncbi:AzlD domain-containing protein [Magnetospirillum sulfuroxidans]|uniref:AzlD domain-containing protein n=1 Tax=Magnetospirillum sulfuroxidans TaxID=611300 RepID=A0ABS5I997_9PROT|nr:AzlD domain-containing protein [Magnetospirillum sulfuroxidans]MBR9970894.1 AzlD domain-containing protein [Magnetospirillum sulfuroxidans]